MLLVLAGCATAKVDWDQRVGHFTYDQAVAELGTPDNVEMLKDGGITADWHTHRGVVRKVEERRQTPLAPDAAGWGAPVSDKGGRALRLTFDRAKILRAWTR